MYVRMYYVLFKGPWGRYVYVEDHWDFGNSKYLGLPKKVLLYIKISCTFHYVVVKMEEIWIIFWLKTYLELL